MMSRLVPALLAASMLWGCTQAPVRDGASQTMIGGSLPLRMPVVSLQEQRFLTVRRQQLDFSCGSAALATLLSFHHDYRQDEQTVFLGMWNGGDQQQIRRAGFSLLDMKRYLDGRGIRADGFQVGLDEIESAGVPGIALVNMEGYRHFVVLKGLDSRTVLVGDPALGLRRIPRNEFLEIWNGVLFVLLPSDASRPVFNGSRDTALAPVAAISSSPALPLSLQALALVKPLPNEY